jgi:hypothetical protein
MPGRLFTKVYARGLVKTAANDRAGLAFGLQQVRDQLVG